ncbi:MAG: ABC transporter ATP-binding protein [Bacteroidetes bacterium]|nr:MAG: ABC transporter ATP-binding protein [Bacteroidota bacterium]
MINGANIFLKYGDRVLFDSVDFVIGAKDKVGLVGRNGAGKSTLLKIIAGELTPDEGQITRPAESTLGFLHQDMDIPKGKTVMEETLTAFQKTKDIEKRLHELQEEMGHRTDYESDSYTDLLNEFSELNDRFSLLGGDNMEGQAERVLKGLGFKPEDFGRLTDEFSGGWQMRIELAKMLLQNPDFLFLDEPTNHLDIESIIWLERFLKDYSGAVVVISHDKTFLDNVTNRTLEIELGKLFDYKAPYSKAMVMRRERREKMMAAYENQQKVIAQRERTITRFMAKATKTKMAQSMQKQLDKMERIEIEDEDLATMNIRFPKAPRSGDVALEIRKLSKSYGELNVLDGVNLKADRGDRLAFVGQNGQGKTTLAKIIVGELSPSGGEIKLGHNVQIGYYAQNQSDTLHGSQTLLETMEAHSPPEMRTRLRAILGAFMFSGEDAEKKVSVLSGGERARLALACLLLKPFNLLVLDEPTNHLDMLSKEVLKNALMDFDGTLIVVSHDRDFLSGLTNRTIEFRDKKLYDHLGDVNYFLEKRAFDNMREVELSTPANKNEKPAESTPKVELSFEERKKLMREVSNAEKKIDRIEAQIADIESRMANPAFYEESGHEKVLAQYGDLKKDLEKALEDWERAQSVLDSAE